MPLNEVSNDGNATFSKLVLANEFSIVYDNPGIICSKGFGVIWLNNKFTRLKMANPFY